MSASNNNTNSTLTVMNIAAQKATVEAEYKALIDGINSELGADTSFIINDESFTKADLIGRFESRLEAAQKTKTNRTALHLCVASERAIALEVAPLRMGFKTFLQSRFGKSSPKLQKFGFVQAKKPQRPAVSKATAVEKNKATRTVRNTVGKKARLKITAPSKPVPAAAPAGQSEPKPAPKASPNPNPGTAP
jgi:hypothetical protein